MRPLLLLAPLLLAACPSSDGDGTDTDVDTDTIDTDVVDTEVDDTDPGDVNHPPTAPEVSLGDDAVTRATGLVAEIVTPSTDEDGDAITYRYAWRVDGEFRSNQSEAEVPAGVARRGEVWEVEVTPNDGYVDGPSGTASITVGNTTPELSIAWVTAAPDDDDDLRVSVTTSDLDQDPLIFTYTWTRDGLATSFGTSIVPAAYTEPGQNWRVVVEVDDGHGGVVVQELEADVSNRPPEIGALAIDPSDPGPGEALVADLAVTDPDRDTLTTTWAWTRNGAATSYTTATVPAGVTAAGQTWAVTVLVRDGHGGTDTATASVVVTDQPPELVVSLAEIAAPGDALEVYAEGIDPEGAVVSLTYAWTVDGVPYGGNSPTIPAGVTVEGQTWEVTVTANDGRGNVVVRTASVFIDDQAPTVWSAVIRPANPADARDLRVEVVADDPEGEPVTITYLWTVNFAPTTYTTDTVPASATTPGEIWQVKVQASDGVNLSNILWSQAVTIQP